MANLHIDLPLELRSPVKLGAETADEPQSHVYFSRMHVDDTAKNVLIIVAVQKNAPTPLLSNGVRARVSGDAVQVGNLLVIQNPTLRLSGDGDTSSPTVALKSSFAMLDHICPDIAQAPEIANLKSAIDRGTLTADGTSGLAVKEFTIGEDGVPTWDFRT